MTGSLVPIGSAISRTRTPRHVPRHRHLTPYAALVLRGGYVEAGDSGRFGVGPGTVLLHGRFEAHQDDFGAGGADILNIPLDTPLSWARARVSDPDAVAALAGRDLRAAALLLAESLEPDGEALADWPDLLASDLRADLVPSLGDWARSMGLAPAVVSRGFRLCYGVPPQLYRLEQRARRAAQAAWRRSAPLAEIAHEAGFSDQAHLTRATRRLYGCTPREIASREVKCVQEPGRAGR